MSKKVQLAIDALNNKEVQEAALTLAKYNLAICIPHMHDEETGELITLPAGTVSCERNLVISFEKATEIEEAMMPVGWRWNGTSIEVCYSCCPTTGPG